MWNSIIYNTVTYQEEKDGGSVKKNKARNKNI